MKEGPPLVSIVLPVHNGERYLRESVQSCIDQTYQNWELIAVDDCSADGSGKILSSFANHDPRIRILRNAENVRLPRTLNVGFGAARGEILTWTSDDNVFLPSAIEEMVEALRQYPEAMMVYAGQDHIDESGAVLFRQQPDRPEALCYYNTVNACFAYRRKVWDALGGYDHNFELVEDWEYWLRIATLYDIQPVHACLYLYRQHAATLSSKHADRRWRVEVQMLEQYLPKLRHKWPAGYTRGFLRIANERWRRDDRSGAWLSLCRALKSRGAPTVLQYWRTLLPLCFGKWFYYAVAARWKFLRQPSG